MLIADALPFAFVTAIAAGLVGAFLGAALSAAEAPAKPGRPSAGGRPR